MSTPEEDAEFSAYLLDCVKRGDLDGLKRVEAALVDRKEVLELESMVGL